MSADNHAVCAVCRWVHIKARAAEIVEGFVEGDLLVDSRHDVQCWLKSVPPIPLGACGDYTSSIVALAAMLRISQPELDALRRYAEQAYPEECCGVLLGHMEADLNQVVLVAPVANIAEEARTRRYQIAPEELIRLQRTAREQGLSIVGFYHSHPEHAAQWSPSDLSEAHWTGCSYVITSVRASDERVAAQTTRSFRLTGSDPDKQFTEEEIVLDAV